MDQDKQCQTTSQAPSIPKDESHEALGFNYKMLMVSWFIPSNLIMIAARVVISFLFGQYADKRELQAALKKPKQFDYSGGEEIWFDYVADLGDGWDSTYTVAKLLAEPTLTVTDGDKKSYDTKRGSLLVMGGDEVYPVASRDAYRDRTEGPYRSALPWVEHEKKAPRLFALPGNHDWYDGLTSFTRLFCQERWIGGWKTEQSRSYFALQLPHRWWLFAVDIQLGSDLDKPQVDYFDEIIANFESGDRVIFASATPSWLMDSLTGKSESENITFIEKRIRCKGATIYVNIAGDLHHYARYSNADDSRQYVTAGGGGAFLHGTHALPDEIDVKEEESTSTYSMSDGAVFPDKATSKSLLLGNFLFFYKNYKMSLMFGLIAAVSCWVIQSESLSLGYDFLAELSQIDIGLLMPFTAFGSYLCQMLDSPLSALCLMVYIGSLTAFCQPFPDKNKNKMLAGQLIVGTTHGLLQFGLMLTLLVFYTKVNIGLGVALTSPWHPLLLAIEITLFTGIFAGMLMGVYLYLTNYLFNYHAEAAFSSNAIADYKNFIRFHINSDGQLTLYPMGIKTVDEKWKLNEGAKDGETWFVSTSARTVQEYAHLIETPITINTKSTG
ncbi:MAG: hypothetical protein L3J28_01060 [Candidatus Polarisedimenticolaceae bacterium]|nr:hypothetical protein [Candidatus Polarisedimenticolaceae bacterium]